MPYIPPDCKTLADADIPQIRLGIQGYGKTGKTWGALTFPNPIVVNLDRGLGAFAGRTDIIEAPFYDNDFCKKVNPNHSGPTTLKDTLLKWLDKEGKKLEKDQTLIWDGGTATQAAYHKWYSANEVYTKSGKVDDYGEFRLKIEFFSTLCEDYFKKFKCNVIYLCHEFEKPDKFNESTGKIRPLMSGQFANQLSSQFTDWFRQHSKNKYKEDKIDEKVCKDWGLSKVEIVEMQKQYPRDTIYLWQTESDDIFDGGSSTLVNFPRYIPSNYESFKKYMRQK